MSRVESLPRLQYGRYISAGHEGDPGINDGTFYELVQQNGWLCGERLEEHHAYVSGRHCLYRSRPIPRP